jgi:hypothetical protein
LALGGSTVNLKKHYPLPPWNIKVLRSHSSGVKPMVLTEENKLSRLEVLSEWERS